MNQFDLDKSPAAQRAQPLIEQIQAFRNNLRYHFFIKRVVAVKKVWALTSDAGWITGKGKEGDLFPVWPDRAFASRALEKTGKEYWPNAKVASMTLKVWRGILCKMTKEGDRPWVFPNLEFSAGSCCAGDMMRDIEKELAWVRQQL